MSNVESKIKTAERPSKRKHLSEEDTFYLKEVEVENFLQILSRVSHSEEERRARNLRMQWNRHRRRYIRPNYISSLKTTRTIKG